MEIKKRNYDMRAILLRFSEKEHLESLQDGNLLLKPIKAYKGFDSIGRLDDNEGYTHFYTSKSIKSVKLMAEGKEIELIISPEATAKIYNPDEDVDRLTHITCFSIVEINMLKDGVYDLIDERMKQFGSHVLLINEMGEFIDRFVKAAEKHPNISDRQAKPIQYLENDYDGVVDIFNKYSNFKWQSEWRCAVRNHIQINKEFILNIGSIRDISHLYSLKDFVFKYEIQTIGEDDIKMRTLHSKI